MTPAALLHPRTGGLRLPLVAALAAVLLAAGMQPAEAATPARTVTVNAVHEFSLKGLKQNRAVQKAYIATKYVYVTQRDGGTIYLSRLKISGSNAPRTATYVDHMTFKRIGHGQTLDMYTYRGKDYFYFSSKDDPSTDNHWSLQVARTQYAAKKTLDYTDLRRFTYLNYANRTGSRLGTTYRVDGGGNSTHTYFRIQTKEGRVTWSIYDTVKLNALLDKYEQVRMDSAAARAAWVSGFSQTGSAIVRPNGSFQGADLLGSTKLYTAGGAHGQTPQIAYLTSSGSYRTLLKVGNVGKKEIEGVQTKNNKVYFTIVVDPTSKTNTQRIYSVPDSKF